MCDKSPLSGWIEGEAHFLPIRVYYEDTDTSGIVYHARYLHFFERARTEFLRCLGIEQGPMLASHDPLAFAVKGMELDFIRPAKIDEALVVKSRLSHIKGASVTLSQAVEREGETLVKAQVRVAIIGKDLRPRRIPIEMRRHFEAIKGSHGIGEESPL